MRPALLVPLFFTFLIQTVSGQTESEQKLFDNSLALFRQAKFQEMIDICESARTDKSLTSLATGLMAMGYAEQGDNLAASKTIALALENAPENNWQLAMLHSLKGFVELRQGLHAPALESVETAIELSDELAFPYYVKSFAYYHRGQNQKCIDAANECLKRNSENPMALILRGICQRNFLQEQESFASFVKAMQIDPEYVMGAWVFAMEFSVNGETERAFALLDIAEQTNADFFGTHVARAFAYQVEGNDEEQEACLRKAYELNNQHIEPLTSMGFFLLHAEQFDEAKEFIDRCIKLHPKNYHSYLMRGVFYLQQDKFDLAMEDFQRTAELNPTHDRPIHLQAMTYLEDGKLEKAVRMFREWKEMNPRNWYGIMQLGQSLAKLGQHEEAVKEFTEALKLDDDYGVLYAERAFSYEAIGESEKAAADFEKAKELGWEESLRDFS